MGPIGLFSESCVDGPLDSRVKVRILTGGSIAIMCPACWRGIMTAGPDGFRDPVPNSPAAAKADALTGFSGSSVRPIVISSNSFTPAPTHARGVHRPRPGKHHARHRGLCRLGHPVTQSQPKPPGGSTPVMPEPPHQRWSGAGKLHRSSSSPRPCGRFCWQVRRRRVCAACGAAELATIPSSAGCLASKRR